MANNNLQLAFSVPYRYVITERSFITAQVIGSYFYSKMLEYMGCATAYVCMQYMRDQIEIFHFQCTV